MTMFEGLGVVCLLTPCICCLSLLSCVLFLVAGSGEGQDAGDDEIGSLLRDLRDKVSCMRLPSNRRGYREGVIRWSCVSSPAQGLLDLASHFAQLKLGPGKQCARKSLFETRTDFSDAQLVQPMSLSKVGARNA